MDALTVIEIAIVIVGAAFVGNSLRNAYKNQGNKKSSEKTDKASKKHLLGLLIFIIAVLVVSFLAGLISGWLQNH